MNADIKKEFTNKVIPILTGSIYDMKHSRYEQELVIGGIAIEIACKWIDKQIKDARSNELKILLQAQFKAGFSWKGSSIYIHSRLEEIKDE